MITPKHRKAELTQKRVVAKTEAQAALLYNKMAQHHHGEYACLNIVE